MKKILCMILALAMVLSMSMLLTACKDKAEDNKSTTAASKPAATEKKDTTTKPADKDTTGGTNNTNPFPEALTKVPAYPVPDIANTGWTFSGGMIDDVEMEEADAMEILEACGGKLEMVFQDGSNVTLINGETAFPGTYSIVGDGYFVDAVFEGYAYYGVFTTVEETPVLILVNKASSNVALYMTQIEEG